MQLNYQTSPVVQEEYFSKTPPTELFYGSENIQNKIPPWSTDPPIIAAPTSHLQITFIHRKNGGILGMVPLVINPIYTLYHVGIYWVPIPL